MSPNKLPASEVLRYRKGRRQQEAARRHFIEWRNMQDPPIPMRCDNPVCSFHGQEELLWNGKPLKLILDHKNGVSGDNRVENLQFLCPNCNSQSDCQGGRNRGRIEMSEGGFSCRRPDGKKDYVLPAETGIFKISMGDVGGGVKGKK